MMSWLAAWSKAKHWTDISKRVIRSLIQSLTEPESSRWKGKEKGIASWNHGLWYALIVAGQLAW